MSLGTHNAPSPLAAGLNYRVCKAFAKGKGIWKKQETRIGKAHVADEARGVHCCKTELHTFVHSFPNVLIDFLRMSVNSVLKSVFKAHQGGLEQH
jgi:hypothetical protein